MGEEVIIVPSLFLMIGYVFYVIANAFTRRQELRSTTEFQSRLLERMGSVGEFSQFLNTQGGQKFLGSVSSEPGGAAHQRVLRAFQSGMDTFESVGFVGTVSAAVGAGLLTSGYVSLKLSRRMGLINGNTHVPATGEIARSA